MQRGTYRYLAAACISVFALGTTNTSSATADNLLVKAVSASAARDLLTEAGVTVDKTNFNSDGFEISGTLGPGRHVWFDGMVCDGTDEGKSCTEFKIFTVWDVGTPARAEALSKMLDYNYTSVFAHASDLVLWRMDFIQDGVTTAYLRNTVLEFLELRGQAEDVIWPPTKSSKQK